MRCQDTYLCTKNRHRVYYVENPVDNHFSMWITLCHIVFNTMSLLVYSVRCPSVNRGAVLSGRGAVGARCCHAARRKKSFLRAFSDFFKKLFCAQNLCFRLFSPVLRTPTRACVFIIFEKNASKNFLKKGVDMGRPKVYYRDTPRGTPQTAPPTECAVSGLSCQAFNCDALRTV